jgi:hypothetical protein
MTAKTLNALKGWPHMNAVDFAAEFDPGVADILDPVPPGSVVHLNEEGLLELGVGILPVMPLFTFYSSDDPDIKNDGPDPATERDGWVSIQPPHGGGNMLCFPAVIAAELVSTAYVDGEYPPNSFLTSDREGGNAGKLKIGSIYVDMIVGQVSRGITNNGYDYDAVAFWPMPVYPIPAQLGSQLSLP